MIDKAPLTITVPEAGERLGLSRNTAYAAARAGQLPTIKFVRVPVKALEKMLDNAGRKDGAAA